MKRWQLAVAVAGLLIVEFIGAPQQGGGTQCVNEACGVSESTSALSIAASLAMLVLIRGYRPISYESDHSRPASWTKRILAYLIDFFVAIATVTPVLTVPSLLAEWYVTGRFRWNFERYFLRPADFWIGFPTTGIALILVFSYFYLHAKRGRQTVGHYLLGLRIEAAADAPAKPAFGLNVFLGLIGLTVWPISLILAALRPDREFWWNRATHTRVVRINPSVITG